MSTLVLRFPHCIPSNEAGNVFAGDHSFDVVSGWMYDDGTVVEGIDVEQAKLYFGVWAWFSPRNGIPVCPRTVKPVARADKLHMS